ncbi:type II secretion system protein [Candidatus Parcubacteria bacterium]|jgi:type II secretory pathway pseudopilin PulG|nr:MAG: type II secretion system protein [Candidatus Parcubacteria bacterium]
MDFHPKKYLPLKINPLLNRVVYPAPLFEKALRICKNIFSSQNNQKVHKRIFSKSGAGFTLVEVIITAGILGIVGTLLGVFATTGFREWDRNRAQVEAQEASRQALARMTKIIREAQPSNNGSYPILAAAAQSLTVYANVDADLDREQVRLFLDNGQIKIGIINPTGSPATYPTGNEQIQALASFVQNGANPVFAYYDKNYSGSQAALSFPVNLQDVRLVKITLTIDYDPNQPPTPIEMQSSIVFRNLKDNL